MTAQRHHLPLALSLILFICALVSPAAEKRPPEPATPVSDPAPAESAEAAKSSPTATQELLRPARPAVALTARPRTVLMMVTAYCPCTKCCGPNAKGLTASGKPVSTNRGRFVAADSDMFAFGTRVRVPGYYDAQWVEVLDRGSAIKGRRLDVYFPDHEKAAEWGRRWVEVIVE